MRRLAVDRSTSFLLLLLLVTFRYRLFPFFETDLGSGTYWLMATAMTLGVTLSLLLHEWAHASAFRSSGGPTPGVVLFIIGAAPRTADEVHGRWRRAWVHLSGSVASIGLTFLFLVLYLLGESNALPRPVTMVLFHLAAANATLTAFQLLPAPSLDGGRALLAIATKDGRRRAGVETALFISGSVIALVFVSGGVYAIVRGLPALGIWSCLVGVVLARTNHLERETAARGRDVSSRECASSRAESLARIVQS